MRTKQETIEFIQQQYDIGDNQDQEFFGWASDEVLKHSPLTFVNLLRKELEETDASSNIHYNTCILINYIEGN